MNVSLKASPRRETSKANTRKTRCTTQKAAKRPFGELSLASHEAGRTRWRSRVSALKNESVEMGGSLSGSYRHRVPHGPSASNQSLVYPNSGPHRGQIRGFDTPGNPRGGDARVALIHGSGSGKVSDRTCLKVTSKFREREVMGSLAQPEALDGSHAKDGHP